MNSEHHDNRIEWKNDWARWRARDENGDLFEYDLKPRAGDFKWLGAKGAKLIDFIDRSDYCPHWRNTLEARPVESDKPKADPDNLLTGAALHRAIADAIDAGEGPEAFEHWAHMVGRWVPHSTFKGIVTVDGRGAPIRRKPKTCRLIDAAGVRHEWPEPLREEPADGADFWVTFDDDMHRRRAPRKWVSRSTKCQHWLAQGRCHSTLTARDAHEAALIAANLGGNSQ